MNLRFSITVPQHRSLRNLIEAIPETDWISIPNWMEGGADGAEAEYTPFHTHSAPNWPSSPTTPITPSLPIGRGISWNFLADHRRHAQVENAIRDLKYAVGLNHLPSGRFAANWAWLAVQVMAHNLARWTGPIALVETAATTKTLRRRFFSPAGPITRKARGLIPHLPRSWPRKTRFACALARLRALPLPPEAAVGL